jgi:hypothetical protein
VQSMNQSEREAYGTEGWWRLTLTLTLVNVNFVSKPKLMWSTIFFTHITNTPTLYKENDVLKMTTQGTNFILTPKCRTYDCGIRLSIDTQFCHLIFR